MPLVTAQDVCDAVETVLRAHLPDLATRTGLPTVKEWNQLPTLEALTTAKVPALAVTSPGLAGPPTRRSTGWEADWRVVVGVYDRDKSHAATAARTRRWAAVVRQVVLQHPGLGGVAVGTVWVGEEYAERPERSAARTLGGCAVAFDVTVRDVLDNEPYIAPDPSDPGGGDRPTVTSTRRTVTVRPLTRE